MDVKIETSSEICQGCLSKDRRTYPLGEYEIFYNIMLGNTMTFRGGTTMLRMCWECTAKMKGFKHFRDQIYQAQNILMNMYYKVDTNTPTLSKLSTITKNDYDYEYNHNNIINITDNNIITDNKPNETTFELEPIIKLEKLTDSDISQCNDNNDYYSDNEPLPELFNDTTVKEEIDNDEKLKIKKEYSKQKRSNSNKLKEFCVIKRIEKIKLSDKKEVCIRLEIHGLPEAVRTRDVDNFFNHVCLDEKEIEEIVHKKERELNINYKFKCQICNIGFLIHNDMQRHVSLYHHDPNKPNKCVLCKINLPTFEALRVHWKENHSHYYVCKICNAYVRKAIKLKHLTFRHRQRIYCNGCKLDFPTMYSFGIHFKREHSKFICDYCNKVCGQKGVLIKHIDRKHNSHSCSVCCKKFKGYRPYKCHMTIYHPELLKIDVDKEAAYCVECDRQFPSVAAFKNHLKESVKHGFVRPVARIPCSECAKTFTSTYSMKLHLHQVHMQEKAKNYCSICDKYYFSKFALRDHNLNVHMKVPKEKDKICDLCGKGFNTKRILMNHRRTHTGERPFQCSYCSAAFAQKTAMVSHQKKQHNIPCPECGKIFKRSEYMRNHLHQVHMPEKAKFYCAICNKYYANAWGLKNHNLHFHLKVPKIKDKICDLCGRGFHTNRILTNHRRTHTGERPFQCSYCSASFAQKTAMVSHQKTQHRDITR